MSSSLLFRAKILVWAFCLFAILPNLVSAQLAGTYSIPGNFSNISDAICHLEVFGVSGPVIFNIHAMTYTNKLIIPSIQGVNSTNTITFKHNGLSQNPVVIKPNPYPYPVVQNIINIGCEFVTLDNITIQSGNDYTENGILISADNVTIKNCNISLENDYYYNSLPQSGIVVSSNSNIISNNKIHMVNLGIYFPYSASPNMLANNLITKNEIYNSNIGINATNQENLIIDGNEIYDLSLQNNYLYNSIYGIYIKNYYQSSTLNPIQIKNNKIYDFYGTGINVYGNVEDLIIFNNYIYNISGYGIYDKTKNSKIYHNTILINKYSFSPSAALFIHPEANYINNCLINLNTTLDDNVLSFYYPLTVSLIGKSDFNNLYSANGNLVKFDDTFFQDLIDWQNFSANDQNSISIFPNFVNNLDLHIDTTQFSTLNNIGTSIPIITEDFDGDLRNSQNPDIGADEFNAPNLTNDVGVSGKLLQFIPQNKPYSFEVIAENFTQNSESFGIFFTVNGNLIESKTLSLSSYESTSLIFTWQNPNLGENEIRIFTDLVTDNRFGNDTLKQKIKVKEIEELPFNESFSKLDSSKWEFDFFDSNFQEHLVPTEYWTSQPLALILTPNKGLGDTITSTIFELSPENEYFLSYKLGRGTKSPYPTPSDSIFVEYLDYSFQWKILDNSIILGKNSKDDKELSMNIKLPPNAKHSNFMFRIIVNGTSYQVTWKNVAFMIDDISLTNKIPPNVKILHKPLSSTNNTSSPYQLIANLQNYPTTDSLSVFWKTDSSPNFTKTQLIPNEENEYEAFIPQQPNGTIIQYFIQLHDFDKAELTHPENAPQNIHFFSIGNDLAPQNVEGISNLDNSALLFWDFPQNVTTNNISQKKQQRMILNQNSFLKGKFSFLKNFHSKKVHSQKNSLKQKKYSNQINSLELDSFKIYRSQNSSELVYPSSVSLIQQTSIPLKISFFDSTVQNENKYFYVITAVYNDSLNGNLVESMPSNLISVIPFDYETPNPPKFLKAKVEGNLTKLEWVNPELNTNGSPVNDLKKIKIYRKDKDSTGDNFVLVDSVNFPINIYFYQNVQNYSSFFVTAVDSKGNESFQSNIAYSFDLKSLGGEIVFTENFENDNYLKFENSDWKTGWNVDSTPSEVFSSPIPYSGEKCLNYNNGVDYENDSNTHNFGYAYLEKPIKVKGTKNIKIFFWSLYETEPNYPEYDIRELEIWGKNSNRWWKLEDFVLEPKGVWYPQIIEIPNYSANNYDKLNLRFRFDTLDKIYNDYAGWFIDDFMIILNDSAGPTLSEPSIQKDTDNFSEHEFFINADDYNGVESVFLNYKFGDSTSTFSKATMQHLDSTRYFYALKPPQPSAKTIKITYFYSAKDTKGNQSSYSDSLKFSYKLALISPKHLTAKADSGEIHVSWFDPTLNFELGFDDGTSEFQQLNTPPGLNSPTPISFATRFETPVELLNPQISKIKIYFTNAGYLQATYKINVFETDSLTNLPSNSILQIDSIQTQTLWGSFLEFNLLDANGIGLEVGEQFFVSISQLTNIPISFGGDTTGTFHYLQHFIKPDNGNWQSIESSFYDEVTPMIRCVVEETPVNPNFQIQRNQFGIKSNLKIKNFFSKKNNLIEEKIFSSYPVTHYNLYKLNDIANTSEEIVLNGTKIFSGLDLFFYDTNVVSPNIYSYTVTTSYEINGDTVESAPGNFSFKSPLVLQQPEIFANSTSLNFGNISLTQGQTLTAFDTLLVTNFGNSDLVISGFNFSGANNFFVLIQSPTVIISRDTLALEINFTADTFGTFLGNLKIVSNDPINDTLIVKLSTEVTVVDLNEMPNQVPTKFSLSQNYPNPFNPTTKIKFGIPEKAFTKLEIFNVLGQKVQTLINTELEPSFYEFQWDGKNKNGKIVSSGVYFYRLEAGNFVETRKMLFLK